MQNLKIATVQFENRSGDTDYNLQIIWKFAQQAKASGAQVVVFHECCISGYTFARRLKRAQLLEVAETVPGGNSVQALITIAKEHKIHILAGLFERDEDDLLYNTYVCVNGSGLVAKFRKLHPFISQYLSPGNEYCIFKIHDWTCGILICYDNNVVENVRATALLGAQILFMPHVTMCTPSSRPGAGFVDPALWENRFLDPTTLRLEFSGMKGRAWLMKWLPARAYDNGIYAVFSNPIGMDDDQLKNGCSMIIDPFGDVVAECHELGDELAIAVCDAKKLTDAGGHRYREARRPELYSAVIGAEHDSELKVNWLT